MVDVSKPYNQGVSPITLNRILLILGVVGLYVSGVLSAEHLFNIQIPCTAGGGCETVARHPSSYIGPIPVAYVGFVGYILLTALALVRLFTGLQTSRLFVGLGYLGSAIGMIASLYLQYVSFTQIQAKCVWCLTSAGIMVVTFVLYTMLFSKVGTATDEAPKSSSKSLFAGLGAVALAMFAVFGTIYGRQHAAGPVEVVSGAQAEARLVPEPQSMRNQLGPNDAPVTIVEYADLCCPTCRKSFPKIHEILEKYPGKVRVIYRHFPLDQLKGHEMALVVAVTAEIAATKGKFWDFATAFTAPEEAPTTRDGVDQIAKNFGITSKEIDDAIADSNSVAQTRMLRDYSDAVGVFHIDGTPTYLLKVKDQPIKKVTLVGVMNELESAPVQALMKKS